MLPPVPLTIEGSSVLHQMFRIRRREWRTLPAERRGQILAEAEGGLQRFDSSDGRWTALFSLLGHKSDLMFVHSRRSFDELQQAECELSRLELSDFLEPASSYLSVVELGLYESTTKVYAQLTERGIEPHSEEWNREIAETLKRQGEAMHSRLYPEQPNHRYICFYPMDRRRGEQKNWYQETMAERARMMHDHGAIGRRYAGDVKQIITGSIGFDDWEWGVDLFSNDPLVFKRLIYEMRFDEVSAIYALFGTFYVGIRREFHELPALL